MTNCSHILLAKTEIFNFQRLLPPPSWSMSKGWQQVISHRFSTKNRSTPLVITSNSLCEKNHVIFKEKLTLDSQPHWFATFETMEFQIYIYPLFLEEWRSTINPLDFVGYLLVKSQMGFFRSGRVCGSSSVRSTWTHSQAIHLEGTGGTAILFSAWKLLDRNCLVGGLEPLLMWG